MMELNIDGMTISPGYRYETAPTQDKFLKREQTRSFFQTVLSPMREGKKNWTFTHSPFYLDFPEGKVDYACTPWGNPNCNVLGWQRPCYLFSEHGYARSFHDLMEHTDWDKYGAGKHPKCADCMVHCGYEPSAVNDSMSSMKKIIRSIKQHSRCLETPGVHPGPETAGRLMDTGNLR